MEYMGVVVRRYIDFLILLIPTPLVSVLFCNSIPTFCSFKKMFFFLVLLIRKCVINVNISGYIQFLGQFAKITKLITHKK